MKLKKNGSESLLIASSTQLDPQIQPTRRRRSCTPTSPSHHDEYTQTDVRAGASAVHINGDVEESLHYTPTLMYGRYSRDLGEFAKSEAKQFRLIENQRKLEDKQRSKELLGKRPTLVTRITSWTTRQAFATLSKDWMFLTVLGLSMAVISLIIDSGLDLCTKARMWLYRDVTSDPYLQYLGWVTLPICMILFTVAFVHLVAPQSSGSGIPEMKVILRGVVLKNYLTFKTLIAKMFGLILVLGSGMPLGKEGPFVHMASIVAQCLSKKIASFQEIHENKSRNSEMLAAACAVGVGSCFSAPIGGVLFSIEEVTTTYFAVRNYWRGFFACIIAATAVRLFGFWFQGADTVKPLFQTSITTDFPYDPTELFIFALTGVLGGLVGAAWVWMNRTYVLFVRSNKFLSKISNKNRFFYPAIIALIVSTLTFPLGTGQFLGGELTTHDQLTQLFSNFSWSSVNLTVEQEMIVRGWKSDYTSVRANLFFYTVYHFFFSLICSTMAVPCGMVIPALKIGAGLGRFVGEFVSWWFPNGLPYSAGVISILPGGYAMVGAAAFSAGATHSIFVAIIVFEITGQVAYIVPVMIGVLVASAVASMLQPSMYDNMIMIKKLPYLPDLLPSTSCVYNIFVEDFMVRDVKFIWHGMSFQELKEVLRANKKLRVWPLVDSLDHRILLGCVRRRELINMFDQHMGREKRLQVAYEWHQIAEERARQQDLAALRQLATDEMLPSKQRAEAMQTSKSTSEISEAQTALETIFQKLSTTEASAHSDETDPEKGLLAPDMRRTVDTPGISKRVQLPCERVVDMSPEDQRRWEVYQLSQAIDLDKSQVVIDPSPFQLVERTSMVKAHSLFSMMGINHAYVTKLGRLVGVVSLKELRKIIEDTNSHNFVLPSRVKTQNGTVRLPNEERPLLPASDRAVDMTVSSLDSTLSNSKCLADDAAHVSIAGLI